MDDLQRQFNDILTLYAADITKGIKADVKKVASQTARKLRNGSPERTGEYARNWSTKKMFEDVNESRYTVYNKAPTYRLTHLLEDGHQKRNHSGMVAAKKHIKPVEEWAQREFEKRVKETIENASE